MQRTTILLRHRARLCGAAAGITLASLLAMPVQAQSLADARVTAGTASVAGLGTTNVVVTQSSDKAVIDWRSFSVDKGTSVRFDQPGTQAIALNRVTGTDVSQINGSLTGNGQVWVLNPNGVLIGAGGSVSAAGFLATTHAIGNADFLAGNYTFDGTGATGGVVNQGRIVTDGGYAVLAGLRVANTGYVQANLGQVVLGAGKGFALDLVGDKLLSFAVTQPVDIAAVGNSGTLSARGGRVVLTARSAADVIGNVINTTGLIDATAVSKQGGEIVLDGGTAGLVYAAGTLDASGKGAGQTGGAIKLFGDTVVVGAGGLLDASGDVGGGTINVGGGWQGAVIDGHASAVRAGVAAGAVLDASAIGTGDGGTISLWSDTGNAASQTLAYGTFLARGGIAGGNGGRIETSGHYLDTAGATGSAAARSATGAAGLWLLDPYDVEIVAAGSGSSPNIVNPGFATGNTMGWNLVGTGGSVSVTVSATDRNGAAYASPAPGDSYFLIASGSTQNSNNGVSQTFTGIAGQSFTLYGLFLGKENPAGYGSFNDNGIVTLTLPNGTKQTLYSQSMSTAGSSGTVPWTSQLVTLMQSGSFTLTATSANIGDGSVPSSLGFDLALTPATQNGVFANSGFGQTWTPTGVSSRIDVSQITGFLNAGTNVQVTTTGAGADAGNITVSAAIAKTAGAAATLRLDATNAIFVNQAIGSTVGALNVTLNAGTGGIQLNNNVGTNGGTLQLNTTGISTQTAAFTTGTLALSGIGGTHTLTNTGNVFATVGGNTGSASLVDSVATNVAGLTTAGALSLTSAGAITLSGSDNFGGATTLATPAGITLAGGAQIATAGMLALEAGTNFTNNAGATAIATIGGGRWLVYSQAPTSDMFGGLVSGNAAVWGATPASTPPGAAPAGNRYLFAYSPTITVTPANTHKTYGDTLDPAAVTITTAGLVNAATYGNVFTQDALSGAATISTGYGGLSASSYTGGYTLQSVQGTLSAPAGYGFAFGSANLTVDPRALILAAITDSRVYDGTAGSTKTPTATGLVNGDTIANLTQAFDSANAGNRQLVVNTNYAVSTDGLNANLMPVRIDGSFNYTITRQTAAGTITPKALAAALIGTTAKTYDGGLGAALTISNYQLTGVVQGDTANVTLNDPATGTYADRNVGTAKTVTATGLALTGSAAGNYTVNASASAAIGAITAKALSASLIGTTTKIYDGATTAALATTNYQLTGVVQSDNVALNNPASGTYADKNVGTGKTVTATGLALTGSDAGNYTVNANASAAIGGITAKALAASLTGNTTKVYDGSTTAALATTNYQLTGVVQSDNVALNNPATGTYADKNVGTGKTVTASGLALTGSDAGNYTVNASASAAIGDITAKALAAALIGNTTKTYDGATTAALATANYQLTGIVQSDDVALNNPATGTYADKNVGTGKTVTATGLALTGSDAGNYTVNANASAAIGGITTKALAASLIGNTTKIYDGATTAALATANYQLTGIVQSDNVALNNPATGTYADKNVGTGKTVTATGLALTGSDAGNYTVNADASAAIGGITAKALAASLIGTTTKTYDGTTTATLATGNYQLTGAVSGDQVTVNTPAAGSYADKTVGMAKAVTATGLMLSGGDANNYTVNTSATANIGSIAAAMLTASLTGTTSKTYDGTTAAALAAANYQLVGAVSGDMVALNDPATGSYADKNAGAGKAVTASGLVLTGTDAGNYTVNASASAAIGNIAAKALTASLTGSTTKTYDGTTAAVLAAGNYQLAGTIAGDSVVLNNPAAASYADKTVGTAKTVTATGLMLSGGDANNYTVNTSATATIGSITAAMLTASLTGTTTKTYDGTTAAALGAANYLLAGAVAGDSVALNDPMAGSYADKNVAAGKTVTVTGLALSGGDAGNYTVNTSAGAAIGNITPAALTASLAGTTAKTYDGATRAALMDGNYRLAGVVSGDTVTLNDPTSGSYGDKTVGSGKTVTATGLALSGGDAGNYTVNASASAAIGSIAAKALTASLTGSTARIYDGTTAATLVAANYQLAGAVSGDSVALNNPASGTYADRTVGAGKSVTATGLALSGSDAGNYTVNASANAAIGSISVKLLAASLTGTTAKTYDGTTAAALSAGNYQLAGIVSGDGVALNNPVAGRFADKNVGTAKLVTASGLSLSGADAGNYAVNTSASAAIGSIAAKALIASLTGSTAKTYDGTTTAALAAGNYQLAGAVAGDGVALVTPVTGVYADKNVGTAKVVTATGIALSGGDAGNYTVNASTSAAIGSIAAKVLGVGLTGDVSRLANGSTAATLTPGNFALTGFVTGESAQVTQTAGQYDGASAGTSITVTTTLAASDFLAGSATALGNYVLPVGVLTGRVGTITPQVIVAIAAQPIVPQVTATVTPVSTAAATPSAAPADAPAAAASPAVAVVATTASSVAASPPSPVAATKPPTPADSADVGDPILAAASPPTDKPAPQSGRQSSVSTPIAGGLLAEQRALPPHTGQVAGVDDAFSGSGAGL